MKVLFLDDDRIRHDALDESLSGCTSEVWHVYSAENAIQAIGTQRFDLICLDFDLGTGASNGSVAAKAVASLDEDRRPDRVLLHTHNRDGAMSMASHLKPTGIWQRWYPFGTTFLQIVKSLVEWG